MAPDVLEDAQARTQHGDRLSDVRPQVPLVVRPRALAGVAERLARISARDDVNRLDLRPVDLGDVAEVGHAWPPVGEHFAGAGVDVGVPQRAARQDGLYAPFEPSGPGE